MPPTSFTWIIAVIQCHNPNWPPYFHFVPLQETHNCIQRDPVKIQVRAHHSSALKPNGFSSVGNCRNGHTSLNSSYQEVKSVSQPTDSGLPLWLCPVECSTRNTVWLLSLGLSRMTLLLVLESCSCHVNKPRQACWEMRDDVPKQGHTGWAIYQPTYQLSEDKWWSPIEISLAHPLPEEASRWPADFWAK